MPSPRQTTSQVPGLRRFAVSLKTKPLTGAKLRDYEAKRDLAAELLESIKQMKAGKTQVVLSLIRN
jgi:hypothetical protein